METKRLLKAQLTSCLTDIVQGAQCVPTLLTLNPTISLTTFNLSNYEVPDCEALHDKRLYNLLPEIPNLLPSELGTECQQLLDTTLPKQQVSGAFLRVAAIKLKLKHQDIHPLIKELLSTIVRVVELLYSYDSTRTHKTVLWLYNFTWFDHELCCHAATFCQIPHISHSQFLGIQLCAPKRLECSVFCNFLGHTTCSAHTKHTKMILNLC